MERPSHIAFHASHVSRRLPLFALAAFLQVGAALLIMTGLGHYTPIKDAILRYVPDVTPPTIDRMPPPEPVVPKNIPVVTPPLVDAFTVDRGINTITVAPREPEHPVTPVQPGPPDHPAIGIASTHTTPPYPSLALRQGLEGQVLLRLSVLETGRVAKAEVMTSSGSEALDQAAVSWIMGHWAYRPALDHGQPVASQAMASISFNLRNAR